MHSKPFEDITGALDASSFDNYIHQLMKKGKSVDYMVLKLDVNTFEKVPDELGKTLNSFWHSTFKNAMLFHMSTDLFVLVIPRESKNGDTESKIDYLMHEIFPKYYRICRNMPTTLHEKSDLQTMLGLRCVNPSHCCLNIKTSRILSL